MRCTMGQPMNLLQQYIKICLIEHLTSKAENFGQI